MAQVEVSVAAPTDGLDEKVLVKLLALYRRPFWRQRGLHAWRPPCLAIGNLPLLELTQWGMDHFERQARPAC